LHLSVGVYALLLEQNAIAAAIAQLELGGRLPQGSAPQGPQQLVVQSA
jgi:hypothetical protein